MLKKFIAIKCITIYYFPPVKEIEFNGIQCVTDIPIASFRKQTCANIMLDKKINKISQTSVLIILPFNVSSPLSVISLYFEDPL